MTDMIDASRQPVVTTKNGEVFTNSRDVAAFFAMADWHVVLGDHGDYCVLPYDLASDLRGSAA